MERGTAGDGQDPCSQSGRGRRRRYFRSCLLARRSEPPGGFGYFSPAVGIWDIATGQNRATKVPKYPPLGVSFSPGGAVAVAGEAFYGWILVCAD